MSTTFITVIDSKFLATAETIEYTSPEVTNSTTVTMLDDFIVLNNGSITATLSAWLVKVGGVASDENRMINERLLSPGEPGYECAEIVGQALQHGDFLVMKSSLASTLTVRGSGRLITN